VKPLTAIYWARLGLGTVAAILSASLAFIQGEPLSYTAFMNGLTVALLVYLVSYYVFKAKFMTKVEKQSKIMTMGIGIYFITWIVFTVLFYTILRGPPAAV
jgi:succinate-acetate transporter protein